MKSYWHSGCLASAGAATVLLLSPNPGAAQSNAELMDIIRQQQRQIEELSRKVDALEGKAQQATEKAPRDTTHRRPWRRCRRSRRITRHQGQVGARADLLEQGRQLVGARARPPAGGRRRARRRRRFLQERQRHRAAPRAPRRRGQLLSGAGSTGSRPTSPTAPSTSRTPTSSTAASSWSPPTSASASTRRRTRSSRWAAICSPRSWRRPRSSTRSSSTIRSVWAAA